MKQRHPRDAYRDENGVDCGQIGQIGGESRQEVVERFNGRLYLPNATPQTDR